MTYKAARIAFFIQAVFGLASTLITLSLGPKGIAVLAGIALRPLVLERSSTPEASLIWKRSLHIAEVSLLITAVTILLLWALSEYAAGALLPDRHGSILLLALLPYFTFVHGTIGALWGFPKGEPQ